MEFRSGSHQLTVIHIYRSSLGNNVSLVSNFFDGAVGKSQWCNGSPADNLLKLLIQKIAKVKDGRRTSLISACT